MSRMFGLKVSEVDRAIRYRDDDKVELDIGPCLGHERPIYRIWPGIWVKRLIVKSTSAIEAKAAHNLFPEQSCGP